MSRKIKTGDIVECQGEGRGIFFRVTSAGVVDGIGKAKYEVAYLVRADKEGFSIGRKAPWTDGAA